MAESLLTRIFESLLELPGNFTEIAVQDPVAGAMITVGGLIMALTLGYMALLMAGVVIELVSPGGGGETYPESH